MILTRRLADNREKRERPDIGLVRGGAGGGALPRLDRRTEAGPRLGGVAAEIHAARSPKHLVEDQQGEGGTAHRERADDAGRAEGDREREAERAVGERLPFGEGFHHTGRFSGRDGEEQEGEDLLRNAEQRQPVRDPLQDSDREEVETRARRIEQFIGMLERHEKIIHERASPRAPASRRDIRRAAHVVIDRNARSTALARPQLIATLTIVISG